MATKSIFAVGGLVLLAMGIEQTNARKTVSQQNEVAGKHAEGTTSKQPETADQRTGQPGAAIEELKALKELFDMGVITEEEFGRKKSELLNEPSGSASATGQAPLRQSTHTAAPVPTQQSTPIAQTVKKEGHVTA